MEEENDNIKIAILKFDGHPDFDSCTAERQDYLLNQCRYKTSWSWLMPLVEKIRKLQYIPGGYEKTGITDWCEVIDDVDGHATYNALMESMESVNKNIIYSRAVEFIKWYNKQK